MRRVELDMTDRTTLIAFIESLKDPFVFADTGHIIRYMNRAAIDNYDDGKVMGYYERYEPRGK